MQTYHVCSPTGVRSHKQGFRNNSFSITRDTRETTEGQEDLASRLIVGMTGVSRCLCGLEVVISHQNRGTQYTIILTIGTPNKGTPNFGKALSMPTTT